MTLNTQYEFGHIVLTSSVQPICKRLQGVLQYVDYSKAFCLKWLVLQKPFFVVVTAWCLTAGLEVNNGAEEKQNFSSLLNSLSRCNKPGNKLILVKLS